MTAKRLVVIESPYSGNVAQNVAFARACVEDSLKRGEVPLASHLLYTQPGILDDNDPRERQFGVEAGWAVMRVADAVVVYTNLGFSEGMRAGIRRAESLGLPVEERYLESGGDKGSPDYWRDMDHPFPLPEEVEPQETAREALLRVIRGIRVRWSSRTPVVVREAMLEMADELERTYVE